MMTKELIKAEIDNVNEADLDELYKVIKYFMQAKEYTKNEIAKTVASGLCGIWQDDRTAEEIIEDIVASRSQSRDVAL